jgi:hypothetical protein
MPLFRAFRARRLPALIACLALFVVGSNYCLISAWGGNARMACLALPKAASAGGCHHCTPSNDASHPRKPGPERSCCPAPVVTPSPISLDKQLAPTATDSAPPLVADAVPSPSLLGVWHGRQVLSDGQPPTRFARTPLSSRAPPLT